MSRPCYNRNAVFVRRCVVSAAVNGMRTADRLKRIVLVVGELRFLLKEIKLPIRFS